MSQPTITYGHASGFTDDFGDLSYNTSGTADSGSTEFTYDTERTEAEDYWNNAYIKFVSGPNAGLMRLIVDFFPVTHAIQHEAFPNSVSAGDKYVLTDWKRQASPTLTATPSIDNDDYFKIHATGGTGSVYWEKNPTNVTVGPSATQQYKKWKLRYKTSTTNITAKVEVVYTSGSEELLSASSSLLWKVAEGTFSQNKTLDKIRIYATSATGDGDVYYDFILICEGEFTFPNSEEVSVDLPPPLYGKSNPIRRDGDVRQNLGSESAVVYISAEMNLGEWGTPKGQQFYYIWHRASSEIWQWFTSPTHGVKFKVAPEPCRILARDGSLFLELHLVEYRRGNVNQEYYDERFGIL